MKGGSLWSYLSLIFLSAVFLLPPLTNANSDDDGNNHLNGYLDEIIDDAEKILYYKNLFRMSKKNTFVVLNGHNLNVKKDLNEEVRNTSSVLEALGIKLEENILNGIEDIHSFMSRIRNNPINLPYQFAIIYADDVVANEIFDIFKITGPRRFYFSDMNANEARCLGILNASEYTINSSIVLIGTRNRSDILQTCVNEEIVQSLGVIHDATNSKYFSFNDIMVEKSLTKYDLCLLSTIFEEDILPGERKEIVLKKFRGKVTQNKC